MLTCSALLQDTLESAVHTVNSAAIENNVGAGDVDSQHSMETGLFIQQLTFYIL